MKTWYTHSSTCSFLPTCESPVTISRRDIHWLMSHHDLLYVLNIIATAVWIGYKCVFLKEILRWFGILRVDRNCCLKRLSMDGAHQLPVYYISVDLVWMPNFKRKCQCLLKVGELNIPRSVPTTCVTFKCLVSDTS